MKPRVSRQSLLVAALGSAVLLTAACSRDQNWTTSPNTNSYGYGTPQGYGTTNPNVPNSCTNGYGNYSYSGAPDTSHTVGTPNGVPQGYGTTNPNVPNSSTNGYNYSGTANPQNNPNYPSNTTPNGTPQGYGTSNPYIPNSSPNGSTGPGSPQGS